LPVEQVTFDEALAFCRKLAVESPGEWKSWHFTLPTDLQWEAACRAGSDAPFHFGSLLPVDAANFDARIPYGGAPKGAPLDRTSPAGSYPSNSWGLLDVHGNVAEWCRAERRPKAHAHVEVVRGGSWCSAGALCRASARDWRDPKERYVDVGFRVALVPNEIPAGSQK
jgi:formylglycine-generating enzyme required for sulfatase activity